ncbi:MAG: ATP-binding cassette, subfamily bacterial [Eubacteriaceae bacterium]|nr:ATP-binding cassette, subfamily bacterial [Eubacteriaceae bacterium]
MINLLMRYLKDYRRQMIFVFVFVLSQAACQLYLPVMMGNIVQYGVAEGNTQVILTSGMHMLLVSVAAAVCMVASSYFSAYVTASFTSRIRADVFDKVKNFSQSDFNRFGAATLLTRSTTDATQMQIVVINGLRSLLLIPITGVGALIMAFRQNVLLTFILLTAFLVTSIVIAMTTRRSMPLFQEMQKKVDRINLLMKEKLTGVRAIRAFNRQAYETDKFETANQEGMDAAVKASYAVAFFSPLMQLMMNITMVVIYWLGSVEVQQKIVDISDLMVFIQYVLMFMSSLSLVSVLLMAYPKAEVSAARVKAVLDAPLSITDPQNPRTLGDVKGKVEFRNVDFGYAGAEKKVLSGISFVAEAGRTTAIVGATGSGKTTLINLLLRLYEVTNGQILVDDVNIKELEQKRLRENIGYAPQESVLFGGKISYNMRVGKKEATDAEIEEALSMAQAMEFVAPRQDGVESVITQGGKDLSGGQRQRLSIARALVKKAPITLFDDCFSALDFKTDAMVRKNINQAFANKTMIIVAQRISTVKDADKIIVLDNGLLVGQGRHEELAETCAVYQEILKSQAYADSKEESL